MVLTKQLTTMMTMTMKMPKFLINLIKCRTPYLRGEAIKEFHSFYASVKASARKEYAVFLEPQCSNVQKKKFGI